MQNQPCTGRNRRRKEPWNRRTGSTSPGPRRQNVTVKYEREFVNPINPYRLVICRVLPWHRDGFLKALGQLPDKMSLLGFTDYRQFCREYLDYSENWMMEKLLTA